jgi:hypothetical protein
VSVGDARLLRSVYDGRVRWAFPHRLVAEDGRIALYLSPGARGAWMGRDPDGRYAERWARGDDPRPHTWERHHVLWLVEPGSAHSLAVFWDESWAHVCWYVNLQAPLTWTPLGFDTTDWALDVWVDPDGRWRWKDEDDFAEMQALGVLDAAQAAEVRAEGERVIARLGDLVPTGWEGWRPDPGWGALSLPAGWDVVGGDPAGRGHTSVTRV